DDVLHHEDVAALDVDVEVLEDADDTRGVRGVAVARDRHEVDLAGDRQAAHQVGHEEDRPFQDADEQEVAAVVVRRDLLAELRDPPLQGVSIDQDVGDGPLELCRTHSFRSAPSSLRGRVATTLGCPITPGTAITSSPRTTSGQASRSALGIFASTNTSWIFFLRPESRSPGLQPRTLSPSSAELMSHSPHAISPTRSTGPRSSQRRSYSRTA